LPPFIASPKGVRTVAVAGRIKRERITGQQVLLYLKGFFEEKNITARAQCPLPKPGLSEKCGINNGPEFGIARCSQTALKSESPDIPGKWYVGVIPPRRGGGGDASSRRRELQNFFSGREKCDGAYF